MTTPAWVLELLRRRWVWVDRGRDYAARRVDCHGFVLGASLEIFGIALPDPAYASALDPAALEVAVEHGRAVATRVRAADRRPGDLVLIRRAGRWHTALYGGEGRVLQLTAAGVSFPSIARGPLARRVEGYWRALT